MTVRSVRSFSFSPSCAGAVLNVTRTSSAISIVRILMLPLLDPNSSRKVRMTRRSLFLSFFAFAVATSSYAAGPPQKVIESFIRAATSSKPAVAYEMLTDATRLRLGEPQFTAYMHVRRELLGGLRSVGAATRAPEQDVDGVTFYAVDLEFERG